MAAALAAPVHRPAVLEEGVEVEPPAHETRILAQDGARSAALSPDRSMLAIGEPGGRVRLWSVVRRADHVVLEGLRRGVTSVLWDPRGQVVVGTDRTGVAAWSVDDPAPLWVRPMDHPVACIDGERLLVAEGGGDHVLALRTGRPLAHVSQSMACTPVPDLLEAGDLVRDPLRPEVLTWSETRAPTPLPTALPTAGWEGLAVVDSWLAGTSREGLVAVRDLGTGALVAVDALGVSGPLASTGDLLAARGRSVLRLDPQTLDVLEHLDADARATSIAASADGGSWAVGTHKGHILLLEGGEYRALSRHREAVRSLAFSSDGRRLASGAEGGTTVLWDLESAPAVVTARQGLRSPVTALALSDDLWVAGTRDGTLHVLDMDGRILHDLEGHAGLVTDVVFTPDGAAVITASGDERVRVWDPRSGELLHVLEGHDSPVRALAMHPSGSAVYAADKRGTVLRWALPQGPAVRLDRDQAMALRAVAACGCAVQRPEHRSRGSAPTTARSTRWPCPRTAPW